jgi:hypothetical protein
MKAFVIFAFAMFFIQLFPEGPEGGALRLKLINEEIAKTTPEGKEIIERVKRMLPEVNRQLSTLPLEELVEKYAKDNNVTPVGWAAAQKRITGRWKILFYYQDDTKEFHTAEWEYNAETVRLYPFDLVNAAQFWFGPTPR